MEYEHRDVASATTTSAEQFDQAKFFKEHFKKGDGGKLEIVGNDLSPVELALLDTEKRRRGSQAAEMRERTRANTAEAQFSRVKEIIPNIQKPVPVDESLKYSDPDEYIKQTLEQSQSDPYLEVFDEASQYAQQTVGAQTVNEAIMEHNRTHPDKPLSEEMINMDLPPRLLQELSDGKVTPQDFLAQAGEILYKPRETHNEQIPVTPDLGSVGGGSTPSDDGSNDKMTQNYAEAIF